MGEEEEEEAGSASLFQDAPGQVESAELSATEANKASEEAKAEAKAFMEGQATKQAKAAPAAQATQATQAAQGAKEATSEDDKEDDDEDDEDDDSLLEDEPAQGEGEE